MRRPFPFLLGARSSPERSFLALAILLVMSAPCERALSAQTEKETADEQSDSSDRAWLELTKRMERNHSVGEKLGEAPEGAQRHLIEVLLADADAFRNFYSAYPTHESAKDARRHEALTLVRAWQAGDESANAQRTLVVSELRRDASIPAGQRSEIAAFADNVAVEKQAHGSRAAKLAAYEEVARKLAKEFPDLPDAYEALILIAKDGPEARASVVADDIIAMAKAPTWVKQEAKSIIIRQHLLGESLQDRTRGILPLNNPFAATDRPLAVYTWAKNHPPSLEAAKGLAEQLPKGFGVVGICLDQRDLEPSREMAKKESLPGEQIYDWLGRRGEIAEALGAVDPGLIYLVDTNGIVRSVAAHRDLAAALAAITAK